MAKNRTPTPVYLDHGMHPGLEVKGLSNCFHPLQAFYIIIMLFAAWQIILNLVLQCLIL